MKGFIKTSLIKLPRPIRVWWGKYFLYMLGKIGTNEWYNDIVLYKELELWIKNQKRKT